MDDEKKIQEVYFLEQNYQNLIMQKQSFEIELAETKAALREIENSGDEVFKIIGQLMIKSDKSKIKEELLNREKILDMKIKSFERQENLLSEKLEKLKKEINN